MWVPHPRLYWTHFKHRSVTQIHTPRRVIFSQTETPGIELAAQGNICAYITSVLRGGVGGEGCSRVGSSVTINPGKHSPAYSEKARYPLWITQHNPTFFETRPFSTPKVWIAASFCPPSATPGQLAKQGTRVPPTSTLRPSGWGTLAGGEEEPAPQAAYQYYGASAFIPSGVGGMASTSQPRCRVGAPVPQPRRPSPRPARGDRRVSGSHQGAGPVCALVLRRPAPPRSGTRVT